MSLPRMRGEEETTTKLPIVHSLKITRQEALERIITARSEFQYTNAGLGSGIEEMTPDEYLQSVFHRNSKFGWIEEIMMLSPRNLERILLKEVFWANKDLKLTVVQSPSKIGALRGIPTTLIPRHHGNKGATFNRYSGWDVRCPMPILRK